MLRISKMTDYGALVMTALARDRDGLHNTADLAARTHVAEPTVAKLLKLLARNGLVSSIRGVHGGYRLARAPEAIRVTDIIAALEGPIALTQCTHERGACGIEHFCGVRGHWQVINRAVRKALEAITLAEMAAPARNLHVQPLMRAAAGA